MSVYTLFLAKELRDIHRTPQLLLVNLLMPLIALASMIVFAAAGPAMLREDPGDPVTQVLLRKATEMPELAGLPEEAAFTAYMMRAALGFFLLMPVILSSTLAAYSVVGEKQQRTLEALLATPISDREFLLGKLAASLVPAIAITWLSGAIAAVVSGSITWTRWHHVLAPDRYWALTLLVLAPLVGAASVLITMRLSARSTDPQAAVQITGLFIVPAFLILMSGLGKILLASITAVLITAVFFVLLDISLFNTNVRKFAREEILTKWR